MRIFFKHPKGFNRTVVSGNLSLFKEQEAKELHPLGEH
jgi:hypothetical protein